MPKSTLSSSGIGIFLGLLLVCGRCAAGAAGVVDVRDYGAKGDGATKDTAAVQAAIDAAAKQGGEVTLPPGNYLCGTLHLKSNVILRFLPGATLSASPDKADFDPYETLPYDTHADPETSYFHYGLLTGENIHDVAILGPGMIDGNRTRRGGPKPIALKNCRQILIRDVTVANAPNYAVSFLGCDVVTVDNVTVRNAYADGIDPDCSRFVRISNCAIDSHDDAICLKSSLALGTRRATEHVAVTNCVLATASNHFKMGTESSGDFKNIALSNCVMLRRATEADRDRAAVSIESVDGAHIDGVTVSSLAVQNVYSPIFIRLGNRGRGLNPPTPGSLENVSITNIVATGATMTCSITGLPGFPVKHINLSDIRITLKGGETKPGSLDVPEAAAAYPESNMFGTLPAYGFYCRHADDLTLRGVRVAWIKPDARPALVADDVRDFDLNDFAVDAASGTEPILWLHQAAGARIQNCRAATNAGCFLRVTGQDTRDVCLFANDLGHIAKPVEIGPDIPRSAIHK